VPRHWGATSPTGATTAGPSRSWGGEGRDGSRGAGHILSAPSDGGGVAKADADPAEVGSSEGIRVKGPRGRVVHPPLPEIRPRLPPCETSNHTAARVSPKPPTHHGKVVARGRQLFRMFRSSSRSERLRARSPTGHGGSMGDPGDVRVPAERPLEEEITLSKVSRGCRADCGHDGRRASRVVARSRRLKSALIEEIARWANSGVVHPDELPRVDSAWSHALAQGFSTKSSSGSGAPTRVSVMCGGLPLRDPQGRSCRGACC